MQMELSRFDSADSYVGFRRAASIAALFFLSLTVSLISLPRAAMAQAALKPEEIAALLLNTANKAFDDKQYPVAIDRYREFLKTFANTKEATAARYGLGLALLEGPTPDFKGAIEALTPVIGVADFSERPTAIYYLGLAHRAAGHDELAQGIAKPAEVAQRKANAVQQFTPAVTHFANAAAAFVARSKALGAMKPAEAAADLEWANRATADQAEMLLQLDKPKEAFDLLTPRLASPELTNSRFRPTTLYFHGHAAYLLKDYPAAVQSLSQLAPFENRVFGAHAQYLLARTHHLAEDRAEAAALYEAVLAGYDKQKAAAQTSLQTDAAILANDPAEKKRLETLLQVAPDYVGRAAFFWAVLLMEQQKTADALPRLTAFATAYPQSPLLAEAQLRLGMCQVELKQPAEAIKTLQPLTQNPALNDRALLWAARAQIGIADPNPTPQRDQTLNTAIASLTQAADRANQMISTDPPAKLRRAEMLLELADTQQLAKQFPQAVTTYQTVINENAIPERGEEVLQRQTTAMHLAAQYDPSDAVCVKFQQTYPKSTLLSAVLFRYAENAYVRAAAIEPTNPTSTNADLLKWFDEATKRYQALLEKDPEFTHLSLARYRQSLAHARLGRLEPAIAAIAAIPQPDQQGELAAVPYHHADLLLRTLPTDTSDALAAARQMQQLQAAIKLLDGFLAGNPTSPHAPDALLKLGYCHRHVAAQLAEPAERAAAFNLSRQAFEKLIGQFAAHPLLPLAVYERAKVMAEQGDLGGSMNEFNRFRAAPLNAAPIAPLAWLQIATMLRAQNKPVEAEPVLAQCRANYEGTLLPDPARAAWAPLLQYHHGLTTKEMGKLPEARSLFDNLVQRFAASPEAPEAAWRSGQCRREDAVAKLTAARTVLANPAAKPEEIAAATQQIPPLVQELTATGQYFTAQATALAQKAAGSEMHLRMLYEAAWCYQTLADLEIEAAQKKLADEALAKLRAELAAKTVAAAGGSGGVPAPATPQLRVPEIPVSATPLAPSEQLARTQYQALIAAGPDHPLASIARLEFAELHSRRDEFDPALVLLSEALDREPPAELEARLRLRIGTCLAGKAQWPAAIEQFMAVAAVPPPQNPLAGEALYRAAEGWMAQQNWAKAAETLIPFRDQQPFQNIPGVSDRALLRLGHALALANQWEPSRQAHETLIGRFPQSPWRWEARYGMGWALQNLKQFDPAAAAYQQVINETAAEVAAKSQYQLALCRIEQKRLPEAATALLVVPYTYDYPQWSAIALLEAGRVFTDLQQPRQAKLLLERVVKDYPDTEWAKTAQDRLTKLPPLAATVP